MIASSSTIKALVLASLAVAGGANNSSIRGNLKQETEETQKRNLMEVPLNKMVCEEDPMDGSVICTFRTMPPTTLNVGKFNYDCLYTSGSNYCLSSEVYLIPFSEVPDDSLIVVNSPTQPPANPNTVGSVGTCPTRQQNTGMGCTQYIPFGKTQQICAYGQTRCDCQLQNNDPSIAVGWNCYIVKPAEPQPPVVIPTDPVGPPPGVSVPVDMFKCRPKGTGCTSPHIYSADCFGMPSCCPGNIFEDWRTATDTCKHDVIEATVITPPTTVNSNVNQITTGVGSRPVGEILPDWENPDFCPEAIPSDNTVDCPEHTRCMYYEYDSNQNRIGAIDCGCNGDDVLQCRNSLNPAFYSF